MDSRNIPVITAFANSPDEGRGLARDMIVRWAFEEAGKPYEVRPVSFDDMKAPAHVALQPFGQIPTYEDGELALFESAAIVFHIAQDSPALLPQEADARARAIMWMFAAQSSVEPVIVELEQSEYLESDKPWYDERRAMVEARVRRRLDQLSARLGRADWLDGAFSAGDLMMVQALRRLEGSEQLAAFANLSAYVERGKARPAFARAFAAQKSAFERGPDAD